MGLYDLFVGTLKCAACGYVCDDNSSNMQTKLQVRPYHYELKVGDKLEVNWNETELAGYLKVAESDKADTISLLEAWDCPNCGKPFNWALIEVQNGRIKSIQEVDLTFEILQSTNFISEQCEYILNTKTSSEFTIQRLLEQLQGY